MQQNRARADLWMDLLLVAFLIGFGFYALGSRTRSVTVSEASQ